MAVPSQSAATMVPYRHGSRSYTTPSSNEIPLQRSSHSAEVLNHLPLIRMPFFLFFKCTFSHQVLCFVRAAWHGGKGEYRHTKLSFFAEVIVYDVVADLDWRTAACWSIGLHAKFSSDRHLQCWDFSSSRHSFPSLYFSSCLSVHHFFVSCHRLSTVFNSLLSHTQPGERQKESMRLSVQLIG